VLLSRQGIIDDIDSGERASQKEKNENDRDS